MFLNGVFVKNIIPVLTSTERQAVAGVQIEVLPSIAGREVLGFETEGSTIRMSVSSMRLVRDANLAYEWLGLNGYDPSTLDDYFRIVGTWSRDDPPPAPLKALGIPEDAGEDNQLNDKATPITRSALWFVFAHELGHVLQNEGVRPFSVVTTPDGSQRREADADAFAADLLRRMNQPAYGAGLLMTHYFCLMPNPANFPSSEKYEAAVRSMAHPLLYVRLRSLADQMDEDAKSPGIGPGAAQKSQALAALFRQYADFSNSREMQEDIAKRTRMLTVVDLAPRKRGQFLGRPVGRKKVVQPFEGRLSGTISTSKEKFPADVVLEREGDHVSGALGSALELVRIDGDVRGDQVSIHWRSWYNEGTGSLRRTGQLYEGHVDVWPALNNSTWTLRDAND
jgi:hypothetical protein